MVKASVIVITYNQEDYIAQALESVLKQSCCFSIEILVGNDASEDGTAAVLADYQRRYPDLIQIITNESNVGASKNLYQMLMRATGKYIALLEGDDYWLDSQKLQKQVSFLEKHLEFSACTHNCLIVDPSGIPLKNQYKHWIISRQIFRLKDCRGFFLSGQTGTIVMRNIFRNSSTDWRMLYLVHPLISDRTLQAALAATAPIFHANQVLSAYRQNICRNGANATSQMFVENVWSPYENFGLTERLESYIKKEFGKSLHAASTKHMFFTVALGKAIWKPDRLHWQVVWKILSGKHSNPLIYIGCVPIELVKRIYVRIKEGL